MPIAVRGNFHYRGWYYGGVSCLLQYGVISITEGGITGGGWGVMPIAVWGNVHYRGWNYRGVSCLL